MSWTTSVIIDPGETHNWRFLGGNRQDDFTMLSLLPEPYFMSLENKFTWTAEYLDLALVECKSDYQSLHPEVRLPNN